jgi:FixJ family two-component response regulator
MSDQPPLVLIVDDDAAIGRVLQDALQPTYRTQAVTSAQQALEVVREREVAIVLADQRMPGTSGLELLTEARHIQPTAVGVLMTAHADVDSAIRAINTARVLGFVTKPWDERELLLLLGRALEAHQTLKQISRAAYQPERELRMFEDFSGSAPVPITAQRFGVLPLRESLPREFQRLSETYSEILRLALEQRVYKLDHKTGDALHEVANRLGSLSAGPRDVVDLHVSALRDRMAHGGAEERAAVAAEARLLVLELMGHLVTYYRSYTLGVRA